MMLRVWLGVVLRFSLTFCSPCVCLARIAGAVHCMCFPAAGNYIYTQLERSHSRDWSMTVGPALARSRQRVGTGGGWAAQ